MKNLRTFFFFGLLVTFAAALGLSTQQGTPQSSLPSVDNPGPLGLRALYLYLDEGGASVAAHRDSLTEIPDGTRTVVIPAPQGRSISSAEVEALERFVRAGGTLVFLAPQDKDRGHPALEQWLELERGSFMGASSRGLPEGDQDLGGTTLDVWVPAGAARGLSAFRVSRDRGLRMKMAEAVPIAGRERDVALWRLGLGKGEVYVAAGPDLAENRRIELLDNLRFWDALAARGPLLFDEYHHSAEPPPPMSQGIWAFVLQCLAVGGLYVFARGQRFGAPRPQLPERHRSTLEYVQSLGWLTRRAHVERELLPELARRLRQLMHERLGIPLTLSEEETARMLEQRCGIPSAHYLEARAELARALDEGTLTPKVYAQLAARYARLEAIVTGRASSTTA